MPNNFGGDLFDPKYNPSIKPDIQNSCKVGDYVLIRKGKYKKYKEGRIEDMQYKDSGVLYCVVRLLHTSMIGSNYRRISVEINATNLRPKPRAY